MSFHANGTIFCTMTMFVHVVMYSYVTCNDLLSDIDFTIRSKGGIRRTILLCSQFVMGLFSIAVVSRKLIIDPKECPSESWASVGISFVINLSYLLLLLQFAELNYKWYAQLRQFIMMRTTAKNYEGQNNNDSVMAWQCTDLTLEQKFEQGCKMAVMLSHTATSSDMLTLYGCYKRVQHGLAPLESTSRFPSRDKMKLDAWINASQLSLDEARIAYIEKLDELLFRKRSSAVSLPSVKPNHNYVQETTKDPFVLYSIKISGMGSYYPSLVVDNAEIQLRSGNPNDAVEATRIGVNSRHFCGPHETMVTMSAEAIRRAAKNADVQLSSIDLIICGSGLLHQPIPDNACLIQNELGLGSSGIRAFSVHATCLSFMVALDVAGALMHGNSKYRTVAIVSASKASAGINFADAHTAGLFGDGAAAAIVTASTNGTSSAVHASFVETYGVGFDCCQIRGSGTHRPSDNILYEPLMDKFQMNGTNTIKLISERMGGAMDRFLPGLQFGLNVLVNNDRKVDIDWIVPHQASGLALDALGIFGWAQEKILRTLSTSGNCVAASIPLTLAYGIESGKIRRGDRVLIIGTSAGISIGAMLFTY